MIQDGAIFTIEIGGLDFVDDFLAKPKLILTLKVVFGKLLTKPKLCTKFEVTGFNGCRSKSGS